MKNKPIENKKIKVVEVSSDSNIGGAGKCILTFLKTFDREKFDVSVILPRNSLLKSEVEKYRVKVFEADNLAEKSLSLSAISGLKRLFKRLKPDVVHTHASMSARIAAKRCGIKIVYTRHSVFPPPASISKGIGKAINGFVNNHTADRIIAVAEAARDNLIATGVDPQKIEVILNGVDALVPCDADKIAELKKKYKRFISEYQQKEDTKNILHEHSDIVWGCWFQGMEHAPKMVQYCFESLKSNLRDKRIILITEENYKEYVQFPAYILEKYEKGCFSKTHLSDLLRLELLIKYGGTWIDATVWCSSPIYPDYLFDSDLFMFQNLKPGLDGQCTAVSSWFITSCSNNQMLVLERALLYEYWKENTKLVHYYLFHMFFQMVIEAYPDERNKVVPFSNATPHILLLRLFEEYDETIANAVKEMTSFHKLTYKFEESDTTIKNTFYQVLFGEQE